MPGTKKTDLLTQRREAAADVEEKLQYAEGAATQVISALDDQGLNAEDWNKAYGEIAAILKRVRSLPR
jgi:hypothetical protein